MQRGSLRKKFLIYMLVFISLLMGGVFFVIEKNNRSVILSEWKKRGVSNAMYLAALSTSPLLMYDYSKLEQNVDEVAKEPDVVYAIILDWEGKVMAHSGRDDLVGRSIGDPVSENSVRSRTQLIQEFYDRKRGEEIWDISYPIYQNARKWGVVRIGFSKKSLLAEIARNRRDILILSLFAMIIAGAASMLLADRISKPIRRLSEGALSISRGNFDREIAISTGDEIEELSNTFNNMTKELAKNRDRQKRLIRELSRKNVKLREEIAARERLEEEIIKTERLRALGEMSGGVAHDFNNILGTILGRTQLLLEKTDSRPSRRSLEVIEKAALDGAETVRRIQEFTRIRADSASFVPVDLNEIVEDVIEFTRTRWKNEAQARGVSIEIKRNLGPLPHVNGDPSGLRELFTNLLINAVDAMPEGGAVEISTSCEGNAAVIGSSEEGFRAVLHHEGKGRDRPRTRHVLRNSLATQREDTGRKPGGIRHNVHHQNTHRPPRRHAVARSPGGRYGDPCADTHHR
jgi:signal transduction histidine kinase